MAYRETHLGPISHENQLTLKQAKLITGGLSSPSKMPGYAYNLPPSACKTGCKLSNIPGTVCNICYGKKYRYLWKSTLNALNRRLRAISHPMWSHCMALLIRHYQSTNKKPHTSSPDCNYFRHNEVGDLQSVEHLSKIADICKLTPHVFHWLSTREVGFVADYLKSREIPQNLTIRISANYINQKPEQTLNLPFATVSAGNKPKGSIRCPAKKYGNSCGPCRACWSKKVKWVDYLKH
jgi:hypothetical protein